MEDRIVSELKSLHTAAIDARNGYRQALENAEGKGLTPLFNTMITRHQENADELAAELDKLGEEVGEDGSFMSTVHKTIIDIRALFGGLDEKILPGLIDGEQRNVAKYDEALQMAEIQSPLRVLLSAQRNRLTDQLSRMRAVEDAMKSSKSDRVADPMTAR